VKDGVSTISPFTSRNTISSVIVPFIVYDPLPESCVERLTIPGGGTNTDGRDDCTPDGMEDVVATDGIVVGFADGPGEDGDGADDIEGDTEGFEVTEGCDVTEGATLGVTDGCDDGAGGGTGGGTGPEKPTFPIIASLASIKIPPL